MIPLLPRPSLLVPAMVTASCLVVSPEGTAAPGGGPHLILL